MATSTPEVTPPKRPKTILWLALLVLVLVAAGGAGYFYLASQKPHTAAAPVPVDPIFVALDPFTVNLQPSARIRFLHAGLTLQVADVTSQGQITQYLPEVRSRVLTVLSNRASESLLTPESKALLAGEIKAALSLPFAANLAPPKVASVMFTTFMLQ